MAIDTHKGTTVTWGALTMLVTGVSGDGQTNETIQTTNMGSTEATHTHIPGDYGEGGEVSVTIQYQPGGDVLAGIIGTTGTLAINYGGAKTITSDAIFTGVDLGAEVAGGLLEATYTFKRHGEITYTT